MGSELDSMSRCACTFGIFRRAVLVLTGSTLLACVGWAWADTHLPLYWWSTPLSPRWPAFRGCCSVPWQMGQSPHLLDNAVCTHFSMVSDSYQPRHGGLCWYRPSQTYATGHADKASN